MGSGENWNYIGWELIFLWCSLLSFIKLGSGWSVFPLLVLWTGWGKSCRVWERWNKWETTRYEIWTFMYLFLCWNLPGISEVLYSWGSLFLSKMSKFYCHVLLTGHSIFPLSTLTDVKGWFWATSLVLAYLWSSKIIFSQWTQQLASTSHKLFLLLIGSNCIVSDTCQGVCVLLKVKPAGSYLYGVIVPWVSENMKNLVDLLKSHAL